MNEERARCPNCGEADHVVPGDVRCQWNDRATRARRERNLQLGRMAGGVLILWCLTFPVGLVVGWGWAPFLYVILAAIALAASIGLIVRASERR